MSLNKYLINRLKPGDKIAYIDINRRFRVLTYKEPGEFVEWHKDLPPGTTSRYMAEDNSIIQIPDNAFDKVKIKIERLSNED